MLREGKGTPVTVIIGIASSHRVVGQIIVLSPTRQRARVTGGRKHEGPVVIACEGEGECVGRL